VQVVRIIFVAAIKNATALYNRCSFIGTPGIFGRIVPFDVFSLYVTCSS